MTGNSAVEIEENKIVKVLNRGLPNHHDGIYVVATGIRRLPIRRSAVQALRSTRFLEAIAHGQRLDRSLSYHTGASAGAASSVVCTPLPKLLLTPKTGGMCCRRDHRIESG